MRYAITLAYKGTQYHGWQKQANAHTVQNEIDTQLSILCRQTIETMGCGRTDQGVHAKNFVAHFDFDGTLPENAVHRLNGMLPQDIAIADIKPTAPHFHARFDATYRAYAYRLHFEKNPFINDISWQRPNNLNFELMNEAAAMLIGMHDFKCFCKGAPPMDNYNCHVSTAAWQWDAHTAIFEIQANRFLRNMVRAIVGTLIDVGMGKTSLPDFQSILTSGNRSDAGTSVPAHGLTLEGVGYGDVEHN